MGGEGALTESAKKENLGQKYFFQILLNKVLKTCEKWYLLLRKLIKTKRNKRSGGWYLTNFYKKYHQNLKYNVKKVYIFCLILIGIPFILILSVKNRWGGAFCLTGKICLAWQKLFVDSPLWKLCSHKFLSCLLDEYTQTFYSIYRNINSNLKHKGNELH